MKAASQLNLKAQHVKLPGKVTIRILPHNFYSTRMGFFCKKEVQLQKQLRLPVYIRLGTKEYVDFLERKPNAIRKW